MTLCPFCKSAKIDDHAPCPRCGRSASAAPAKVEADGWGDDEELSRGGRHASSGGPSAYSGGGMAFGDDDPFADDGPGASLELDLPASPRSLPVQTTPSRSPAAAPTVSGRPGSASNIEARLAAESGAFGAAINVAPASGAHPAAAPSRAPSSPAVESGRPGEASAARGSVPDAAPPSSRGQDPAAMIARYPIAPTTVWQMPIYALKVLYRQFELRQDLTSLRRRRSPDVALYERALRTHDAKAFAIGLAIAGAVLALACFLFFLPVVMRFARAPD
jgi:hypothetical protein